MLTGFGSLEDAELILVPSNMNIGKYKVTVTRESTNLYQIDGTDFYIETNYCYQYGYSKDAILDITGNYGYSKGKLILD